MIARRNLDRDLSLWRRGHPDDKAAAEEKKGVFQPSADLNARRRLAVTGRFKRAYFFDGDGCITSNQWHHRLENTMGKIMFST